MKSNESHLSLRRIEKLLSIPEAAEILGVSKWTLYSWCETGKVPSVKLGRLRKIRVEDLRAFIESNRM